MISDLSIDNNSPPAPAETVSVLFQHYAKPICAYIHSLVDDWELAYDLTQETYLRLYRTRDRLPAVENQRAWVYRIATNLAINAVKRRKRFAWLPWSKAHERVDFAWHDLEATLDNQAAVQRALAQLAPEYRAPLVLYSSYDFSVREIAEALHLNESAVKVRLHRARERFRQLYAEGTTHE
ncbi:MAG: sigma-70 family RNA polymerase sigma factor [Caldilinea sp. CFX5]|nr:sigma-70 family RNA polymerase sigma factor [Caldilinea sp. CFX5]